jgi:hypothetical protein
MDIEKQKDIDTHTKCSVGNFKSLRKLHYYGMAEYIAEEFYPTRIKKKETNKLILFRINCK